MSKNVIVLLVTLGHFPPDCRQGERLAVEFLQKESLGFWLQPSPRPALGGREHFILSILREGE